MKLKFLGTAGCTGIPSMWCNCPTCKNARKVKGKEIRSRTGFLLDEKFAIDFSADSFLNMTLNDVIFGNVKHLLITHSHEDHFYPQDLVLRVTATRAHYPEIEPKLNIYGNNMVIKAFKDVSYYKEKVLETVNLIEIKRNQVLYMDDYKVTTFYAKHMMTEDSMVFLIQHGDKSYLHLVDSPEPSEEFYQYLIEKNVKIDAVTGDCTFGSMKEEFGGHMQMWQNLRVKTKLQDLGIAKDNLKYYLTHFSDWNGIDTHESLSTLAEPYGFIVAYDGLTVDF